MGVGNEDFTEMELLDGDITPLYSTKLKRYRERDIVQFVPFSKVQFDPQLLANEVLEEVPKQMTDYFMNKKIKPNPPQFAHR